MFGHDVPDRAGIAPPDMPSPPGRARVPRERLGGSRQPRDRLWAAHRDPQAPPTPITGTAAIHGGASLIITFNPGDFPASVLGRYHVEAVHPDGFVVRLWDESPESVLAAARRQRAGLKRPPPSVATPAPDTVHEARTPVPMGFAACR